MPVLISLSISIFGGLFQTLMGSSLSFCTHLESHHFSKFSQVINLIYSDTLIKNTLMFVAIFILGGGALSGVIFFLCSYRILCVENTIFLTKYIAFSTLGLTCLLYPCFMEHILGCTLVTHPGKLKWLQ
jgi:hypothetical protein